MPMTMADYAASSTEPLQKGIVSSILKDAQNGGGNLLDALPIGTLDTLTAIFTKVNTEGPSTGVGTRPIGGTYPEGSMALFQEAVAVSNYGGRVVIDEAFLLAKNYVEGADPKTLQVKYKTALINRTVNNACMNGDKSIDPFGMNGAKKWVDANQIVQATDANASYNNGLVVKTSATTRQDFLNLLDYLIEAVGGPENPNVCLIMNNQAKRKLRESVRSLNQFAITKDQYGRIVTEYQGVRILNPGSKTAQEVLALATNNTNSVIPNNFSFGSDNTCTEIWAWRLGVEDGIALWNLRPLTTRVIERLEAAPAMVVEMGWYPVLYPRIKNCIAKLVGVDVT